MIDIVPARPEHAPPLAAAMRPLEQEDCAVHGLTPLEAVRRVMAAAAVAWTGRVDGAPVCAFGVEAAALVGREGRPWLLVTDGILPHRTAFLRRNRAMVPVMLGLFPRLADVVDARNAVAIRWLRWLGFRMGEPVPLGDRMVRPFEMEA